MRKNIIVALFICVSLIQLISPLSMILKRESILKNGEQFKFKTMPVDPFDAFRGRYVTLRLEEDYVSSSREAKLNNGQVVYALIDVDGDGFAKITDAVVVRPRGKPYLQSKVKYASRDKIYLDLPIDRYYMEENAAPAAERIHQKYARSDKQDAYIIVRVKNGSAVIENLYVGGQKIEDAVRQEMTK